ncbi:MAG TPA: NUDIX hydrolase [Gemmatimonadales bacterium]|nr:NUDIX hydrolase [Gemmatimonadales bacterium]
MPRAQLAALPFTLKEGRSQVLLVTSRETRRWVIPKGWPKKKVEPQVQAAREAYEEAGIVGSVDTRPIGSYRYEKRLKSGKTTTCKVNVYLLEVEQELDEWPEKGERERRWMSPAEAADLVTEDSLTDILLRLANGLPLS